MEEVVRQSSRRSKEKVLSSQLKEVFQEQGISTRGGTAKLATGGTPLTATLGKPKQKPAPKFSNDSLNKLQLKMGASDKNMKTLGNFLRVNCGRDSVNKHEAFMKERNTKLEEFFETKNVIMTKYVTEETVGKTGEKKKKKSKTVIKEEETPVVFAKDIEELAGYVMRERGQEPSKTLPQLMIDDGQGLLKFMLGIKELDEKSEPKGKKTKYEEGFAPKDFKMSGVKKLILLLVTPTTERYDNLAKLLALLHSEAIEAGYSCDIKMDLLLLGKQPASSKYCCPFCIDCSPWLGSCSLITIGSLWRDYASYVEAGSVLKNAMKFHNVVNPPLITGPDNQLILGETILFPEHHVFTGIVGKLVKELERNVFGDPSEGVHFMNEWMADPGVNVCRTVWHGSASFVGNMAELLLARLDHLAARLREYLVSRPEHLAQAEIYVRALKQLNSVVHSCFGQDLQPDYTTLIADFMVTYRSLEISIPLKVHHLS